jgi:hypothetical protein
VVENESLIVTCQAAKASTRVMHTVVIHKLVGIDLRINEAYCSEMKIKRTPYNNRVALTYFDISLGNTKGYRPHVPAKMARESTGSG